jgi:glycerophosphoryl diester phosphodiesterase family protein
MTNNLYPPARPQTVGEILDTAFRIFRATLLKCLLFAAVSLLVGQLPNIYTLLRGRPLQRLILAEPDPLWWLLELVGSVVVVGLTAAIVRRQYAIASGQPSSPVGELTAAARLVPGFIAVSILFGLAIVVGLFLLVIPGFYVGIRLSCAITAYLLTGRGVFASLSYSWRLTAGNFWRLTLIFSVYIVLILVFYVLAGAVATAVAVPFGLGDVALITAVTTALAVILGSIVTPFYTALALAVFGDLSVRMEGTDLAARISSPV